MLSEWMIQKCRRVAKELNLSETTFVFPSAKSDCEANVRIFTPLNEMIFAGHPTIGTAFVLMKEGLINRSKEYFLLEEKVGPVPVRVENSDPPLIWLRTPAISEDVTFEIPACAEVLGLEPEDLLDITPQLLNAGNPTVFIALKDKEAVERAWLDSAGSAVFNKKYADPLCVFIFCPTQDGAYSRMFAPQYGVAEDPATGSSTGPLAAFMMKSGLVSGLSGTRFISEQGCQNGTQKYIACFY